MSISTPAPITFDKKRRLWCVTIRLPFSRTYRRFYEASQHKALVRWLTALFPKEALIEAAVSADAERDMKLRELRHRRSIIKTEETTNEVPNAGDLPAF